MDEQVWIERKCRINIISVIFACMESNHFVLPTGLSNYMLDLLNITGTAYAKAISSELPAIPAKYHGPEIKTLCCLPQRRDTISSPFPKIRASRGTVPDHLPDAGTHSPYKIVAWGCSKELVLQPMWRGDQRDKVPGNAAVHRYRVSQMRMSIEKSRANPDIRGFFILFDCSDDPMLDYQISRPEYQIFSLKHFPGYHQRTFHGHL
jgi:hypothetical protein